MIVISAPTFITHEIQYIHQLLDAGLSLFHIRKPNSTLITLEAFIHQIDHKFREKLVLHQHHELANKMNIHRIHFNSQQRNSYTFQEGSIYSTSTHAIEEFNQLSTDFSYAFLSPVFPSISKPSYHSKENLLVAPAKRSNFHTKLIALGGLNSQNIAISLAAGYDDVALLGSIWNQKNINIQKTCQLLAHSY